MDDRSAGVAWAAYVVLFTAVAGAAVAVVADSPATGLDGLAFAVACAQVGVLGGLVVLTRPPALIGRGGRAQVRSAQVSAVVAAVVVLTVAADVPLGGLETVAMIVAAFVGVGGFFARLLGLTDRLGDLALGVAPPALVAVGTAGGLTSSDEPPRLGDVLALAVPLGLGLAAIGTLVLFVFGYALRAAAAARGPAPR